MSEQSIYLPTGGALPGIPGIQEAGVHLVDFDARTIRPDDGTTQTQDPGTQPTDTTNTTTDTPAPQA